MRLVRRPSINIISPAPKTRDVFKTTIKERPVGIPSLMCRFVGLCIFVQRTFLICYVFCYFVRMKSAPSVILARFMSTSAGSLKLTTQLEEAIPVAQCTEHSNHHVKVLYRLVPVIFSLSKTDEVVHYFIYEHSVLINFLRMQISLSQHSP